MASQNEGKQMWQNFADSDGWISKSTDDVIEESGVTEYDKKKELEESLNLSSNYFEIEFENEKEERWKFKD